LPSGWRIGLAQPSQDWPRGHPQGSALTRVREGQRLPPGVKVMHSMAFTPGGNWRFPPTPTTFPYSCWLGVALRLWDRLSKFVFAMAALLLATSCSTVRSDDGARESAVL